MWRSLNRKLYTNNICFHRDYVVCLSQDKKNQLFGDRTVKPTRVFSIEMWVRVALISSIDPHHRWFANMDPQDFFTCSICTESYLMTFRQILNTWMFCAHQTFPILPEHLVAHPWYVSYARIHLSLLHFSGLLSGIIGLSHFYIILYTWVHHWSEYFVYAILL